MKTKSNTLNTFTLVIVSSLISACSTQQPVLYPNGHYNVVGRLAAEEDINSCVELATNSGANPDISKEVLTETAEGTLIGGAAGAATGAVYDRAAKGAAAGAAGGAAVGVTRAIINSDKPDQVFKRFVEKCLRDKGYEPIGWS